MKGSQIVAAAALFLVASCADRGGASPPVAAERAVETSASLDVQASPLVIVTLDGTRWQEIFDGTEPARSGAPRIPAGELLPNLYALGTERGAFLGAPGAGRIAASGPDYVSLPGYTEIFGGRVRHACHDNDCGRTPSPTLLDDARASGAKVGAFTSWTKLDYALTNTPGSFTESCGPAGGPAVPGMTDVDASRSDHETATAAITYLESEHPDVLFIGLGEPDEYAHYGNYAAYLDALRHADAVLGQLRAILDRDARGRSTHLVVTADHGRAADFRNHGAGAPESARVWMVASGPRITARGFVTSRHERHLADVAPTARLLLGLPAAPPAGRSGHVLDELFATAGPRAER